MQVNLAKTATKIRQYRWPLLGAVGAIFLLLWNRVAIVATISNLTDKAQWCKKLYEVVSAELPQIPTLSRLIIVAQAAYESGYGKAKAAQRGNNFFNITAGSAWKGEKWTDVGGDTDGKGNRITQVWRIYPNVNAGVQDFWSFIGPGQNRGRYVKAQQALLNGDLPGFIYGLHEGGYFTLNPAEYLSSMSSIVNTVRRFISS